MMEGNGDDIQPDADQLGDAEGVPVADEDEHGHEGTFASGQEAIEHHPEVPTARGDFAEGVEEQHHTHEGSFAEGQEETEHHGEVPGAKRDFAEGQEDDDPV